MMATKVAEKGKAAEKAKASSVRQLRRQATDLLRQLSPERLRAAIEFLAFLREREEWEATWDILSDPKMMAMIRKAEERWRKHGKEAFLPWEEVKKALR
jgi:ribosomal protein L22